MFRRKEEGDGSYTYPYLSANNYSAGETYSTIVKGNSYGNYVDVDLVKKIQDETDDLAFLFPKSFPESCGFMPFQAK